MGGPVCSHCGVSSPGSVESAKFTGKSAVSVLFFFVYICCTKQTSKQVFQNLEAQQAGVGISILIASTLQQVLVEDFKGCCLKWKPAGAGCSLGAVVGGNVALWLCSFRGIGKFVNL